MAKGNHLADTAARQGALWNIQAPNNPLTTGALIPQVSLLPPPYTEKEWC